jgi:hypothetical protein
VALGRVGLDGGDDEVRVDPVRDERLGAVDDVRVAVVVRRPARSDPISGSVMATAVMSEPSAMPGSQRSFCSSVPRSRK